MSKYLGVDPVGNDTISIAKVQTLFNVTTAAGIVVTGKTVCGVFIAAGSQTIGTTQIKFTLVERSPITVLDQMRAFDYEGPISFKQNTTLCGPDVSDCRVVK